MSRRSKCVKSLQPQGWIYWEILCKTADVLVHSLLNSNCTYCTKEVDHFRSNAWRVIQINIFWTCYVAKRIYYYFFICHHVLWLVEITNVKYNPQRVTSFWQNRWSTDWSTNSATMPYKATHIFNNKLKISYNVHVLLYMKVDLTIGSGKPGLHDGFFKSRNSRAIKTTCALLKHYKYTYWDQTPTATPNGEIVKSCKITLIPFAMWSRWYSSPQRV